MHQIPQTLINKGKMISISIMIKINKKNTVCYIQIIKLLKIVFNIK